ncbi:heat shock protein transcriptional repressor HspR [Paeniglutamicibacter gangotriensis]|uniref:Transcriptional repressor GlnR n=2 Tax=Paeniglutamicibacter gangotriensis TaxID=254787 RepID=M7MUZ1_9MICC|nr:MerR family transcriptional regulator [Paeniglutamicibacter gangotriensis]EMQ98846.1 transcriptional repressor GlnR [Paeniglutamicibacter gangotriensis Lz1y]KAA0973693.1 MerR family transcriptional regulator [Paeniglutamicibacter gangotriensis]
MNNDRLRPIFVISMAAELADMHPQTLRQYDRLGLVSPSRQGGKQRRYSERDVDLLREIQQLSKDGVSLEGIRRIMVLENQVAGLRSRVGELSKEVFALRSAHQAAGLGRVFAAGSTGDVVSLARGQRPRGRSQAVVVWKPRSK